MAHDQSSPQIVLLMGVCGTGKSTIGKLLGQELGWSFFDADDFHPPENVEKQRQGIPLTDDDRWPWLRNMHAKMLEMERLGESAIFGCSALKGSFRELLRDGLSRFCLVHLYGDKELIRERVANRKGHFMPASLVDSQFATLEAPDEALAFDVQLSPEEIVKQILKEIRKSPL